MTEDAQRIVTGPIRAGAQTVRLASHGKLVFLYDEAEEAGLRATGHPLFAGFDGRRPQKTSSLRSRLIVYELPEVRDLCAEVLVGEPLSRDELELGGWFPPQLGHLTVTAGRLWVHTYETLPLGPQPPVSAGVSLEVPPGDYTLSVYRKRWSHPAMQGPLRRAREAGLDVQARTHEVVTLSRYDGRTLEGAMFLPAPPLNA